MEVVVEAAPERQLVLPVQEAPPALETALQVQPRQRQPPIISVVVVVVLDLVAQMWQAAMAAPASSS
jgi:hypothetical protein